MRYVVFLCIVICGALSACTDKNDLHYVEEKLVNVTADLYFASEAIKKLDEVRADSLRMLYRHQIEEIHGVEIDLYESDIEILKLDLKKYLDFHKIVIDSIKSKEERFEKKPK